MQTEPRPDPPTEIPTLDPSALFATAFDNAPIGMGLLDLEGRWLRVNRAFCEIVGYGPQQLTRFIYSELTHPDDLPGELEQLERLLAGEVASYSIEKRYLHSAGHPVWVRLHRSVIRDGSGRPTHFISQVEDITQPKQSQLMLTHMVMHDALTGLPNRTLAVDRLEQALARSKRKEATVAVLFLDLDRFKVINDSLGHSAGDRLLMAVGHRLSEAVRPSDTVARVGGDEFLIVCDDVADQDEALGIGRRVLEAVSRPFRVAEGEVVLATSVGVTLARAGDSPEDLIRDADAAMYRAKEAGRARCELFDETMRNGVVERLHLEQSLRRAIAREEFRLHYQPLVSMGTGEVLGVEALLRWEDPERGLVQPNDFIPLAEETGLIVPIGEWVLREACSQGARWRALGLGDLRVAVNLSVRQLLEPSLAEVVEEALAQSKLEPGKLCLEITESVLTTDAEASVEALRALKRLGVQLAVDDFGTGYASLIYLKRFPVDVLKVDRAFVSGLGTDPEDSAIVAGVVGLAKTLGLTPIAEGVETERQQDALVSLGCDLAQGYLFSRPQPADAVSLSLAAAS
ncbi:MAG TPA: EAL domain-containing protein [Actinomycetota bacterium]|nr:EAL domain-containing protein [Actinomycetota bacterium]